MPQKHTYANVKKYFDDAGLRLITTEYVNAQTDMHYICTCGNHHKVTLNNLMGGKKRCPECAERSRVKNYATKYEDIKIQLHNNNLTPLISEEEYLNLLGNGKVKIPVVCSKGHHSCKTVDAIKNRPSCRKCSHENNRGENHCNWNGGTSKEKRWDRTDSKTFHNRWRTDVLYRDNKKCVVCESKYKLIAHHLNGYKWDIENRFNVDNGVTLCEPCHIDFHRVYGSGKNTKEEFEEFSRTYYKLKVSMEF